MTSEERLDRLERIAKLFVRAGLRERRYRSEQAGKVNIIINAQIENEERFAKLAQSHNELAQSVNELARAQTQTENRLDSLIDIIKRDRNGNSS
jgi:uncharacterized protein YceH (UPF0502 family)